MHSRVRGDPGQGSRGAEMGVRSETMDDFAAAEVRAGEIDIFVRWHGSGPPLLLLHGFPQTHLMWRSVAPLLARRFTVVCADLCGYGRSECPASTPDHAPYAKRAMAHDMVLVMERLEFPHFAVAGHDRGARVAYRLALDHPNTVDRLAVLNIVPTLEQFKRMSGGPSLGYWPWFLLAQPAPFPERLLEGGREHFLRFVFDSWTDDRGAVDETAFAEYLAAFDASTIAAMCADYRASFWVDREHDAADRRAGHRIECPVLVATGAAETQLADAADVWSAWTVNLRARTL